MLLLAFAGTACSSGKKTARRKKKKARQEQLQKKKSPDKVQKTNPGNTGNVAPRAGSKADKLITEAKTYIGTPYKFGGTSRSGMDCSGFVLTVYKSVGIELPRTSREQSETGKPVEKKDLSPGDLVFFSRSTNKIVSHTGIVVEAGSTHAKFIHASTSKGVRIDDLYGEYWSKLFLKARRVL